MSDDRTHEGRILGSITAGSLLSGLEAKLSESISVEEVRVGAFAVVDGEKNRFFSLLKDVSLASTNEDILLTPPADDFARAVHLGVSTYYKLALQPMLAVEKGGSETPLPSTTVPPHFSPVLEATPADVELVFGREDEFHPAIGSPVFMDPDIPVCLDLEKFAKRSNALFGRSGCGKSVLARIILGYLMRADAFVNLVFDMHNEFGWTATSEEGGSVDSLRKLLGTKVAIFTLDPHSPLYQHGQKYDSQIEIPLSEIRCSDIELLNSELGLSQVQRETMYKLEDRWGEKEWLAELLSIQDQEMEETAGELGLTSVDTLRALCRKFGRLKKLPFLKERVADDAVRRIREHIGSGRHVVVQFGRYNDILSYILIANILTRRLHEDYARETDAARAEGREGPTPLIISIEEAHKFLDPSVANSTVFGTIAREARKYKMVLFLIDQRPSGIDDEVLSQVGTRIIGKLDDEHDVNAALSGRPNQATLKVLVNNMVERQFLLTGYALPMPVVINAKDYRTFSAELELTSGRIQGELKRRRLELSGNDEIEL